MEKYLFTINDIIEAHASSPVLFKQTINAYPNEDGEYAYSMNFSSEFSYLIENTGRFVERYQSDLLYGINSFNNRLDKTINNLQPGDSAEIIVVFGLRDSGVDHDNYVLSNMNGSASSQLSHYYRRVYTFRAVITWPDENSDCIVIKTELSDATREIPQVVYRHSN